MFVQRNDLAEIKAYFSNQLKDVFSANELRLITKQVVIDRLGISSVDYMLGDVKFSESDLLYFRSIVKRLLNNEPLQHILGVVHFCELELKTDARALIPRPETEELIHWIRSDFENEKSKKVFDVCAGSGCIALAIKDYFPSFDCVALELSDDALELLKENIAFTNSTIRLAKFDALGGDYSMLDGADIIVSNPPYIPYSDKKVMHPNVLDFEPEMALFVTDEDPLLFYREIGNGAWNSLQNNGWIYFEIHEELGIQVMECLKLIGFVNIELRKDLQGKDRMVRAQKVLS